MCGEASVFAASSGASSLRGGEGSTLESERREQQLSTGAAGAEASCCVWAPSRGRAASRGRAPSRGRAASSRRAASSESSPIGVARDVTQQPRPQTRATPPRPAMTAIGPLVAGACVERPQVSPATRTAPVRSQRAIGSTVAATTWTAIAAATDFATRPERAVEARLGERRRDRGWSLASARTGMPLRYLPNATRASAPCRREPASLGGARGGT